MKLSRRSFVFAAGLSVGLSELVFRHGAANAVISINNEADRQRCIAHEGEFNKERDFCHNTIYDKLCEKKHGKDYAYFDPDKSGEKGDFDYKHCDESDCFLTTACVQHIGLDDDCFELTALRQYRDQILLQSKDGIKDVSRYYELAPRILSKLMRSDQADRELSRLYALYIVPSVVCARLGCNSLAYRIYKLMLGDLVMRMRSGRFASLVR